MSIKNNRREWLKLSALSATALAFTSFDFTSQAHAQNNANKIIKLSANENPYGFSPKAKQAILESLSEGNRYVNATAVTKLEQEIANREGLKPENVVLGGGSGEVLCIAGVAYGLQNGEIISPDPTFAMLTRYAANFNAKILNVPLNAKFEHDLGAMARQITDKTSLIYVCNPNNPTATITPDAELRQFCRESAKRAPVFVDEAYLEYTDEFPRNSMVDLVKNGENVIVSRTFSKIYGMAGLRVGYGLAKKEIADKLKKYRITWSVNNITINAALASLQDAEFVPHNRKLNQEVRTMVCKELDAMKVSYAESHGNFVWVRTDEKNKDIAQKLSAAGIQVGVRNPLVGFDGLRVAIGTADEMKVFLKTLKGLL